MKACFYCGEPTLHPETAIRRAVCISCTFAKMRFDGRVRSPVTVAVRKGTLPKASTQKCVDCGQQAAHYDHRDYAKPLEVEPVCRGCNARRGPALNGFCGKAA